MTQKKKKKFPWFRKGLFCIMWSSRLYRNLNYNQKYMLLWGSRIQYGIFILPKDIWIHVWLPKWCEGRGYYISIGLWLFSVQRGY